MVMESSLLFVAFSFGVFFISTFLGIRSEANNELATGNVL